MNRKAVYTKCSLKLFRKPYCVLKTTAISILMTKNGISKYITKMQCDIKYCLFLLLQSCKSCYYFACFLPSFVIMRGSVESQSCWRIGPSTRTAWIIHHFFDGLSLGSWPLHWVSDREGNYFLMKRIDLDLL